MPLWSVLPASSGRKEIRGLLARRGKQDLKDPLVLKDLKVRKVPKARKGLKVCRVQPAQPVSKDPRGYKETQARPVLKGLPATRVLKVFRESRESAVRRD